MEGSIENLGKGDVISVPFPFSDASATKRRPALVIAESDNNNINIIVSPITSKSGRDYEIKLEDQDFRFGKLNLSPCYIRPNIIATIDKRNVIRFLGKLKDEKINEVTTAIIEILQKPPDPPPSASKALERGKSPKQ